MPWIKGDKDAYKNWGTRPEGVTGGDPNSPHGLSACPKLKKGQLLMHRHLLVYERGNNTKYQHIADESKKRSIILAERMRDHADKCSRCSQGDENFYGLEWF